MNGKNIIIAASGTGGHIYPGIALARELKDRQYNPVFFVSNNEASGEIIKNSGYDYVSFNLSGMPRKISFSFAVFFVKLIFAFFKALKNMFKLKPAAVIGAGGYISAPAILSAKLCGKKTFIHEQNTVPGISNKFLNIFSGKTFISFKDSEKYFKNKNNIMFTGYPVRREIFSADKDAVLDMFKLDKSVFTLMVFGGSLGAVKLNETVFEAVKMLSKKMKLQTIHITGKKGFDKINLKPDKPDNYLIFDYMHNIAGVYAVSDLVICRAGAGTVFELKFLDKPAILVPYPYATDNHQYYNAKEASKDGNIAVIEEKDLTAQKLADTVEIMKGKLKINKKNSVSKLPQEIMAEEIIKSIG
ncbi:MAG: undecaprenyldiphospho-muramoylpentapeptide beta-N-acetylglucosaminyltransferase [Endomicrobium sp.]|jgi:UDP-N-acetylglucosamine--N-acetylmuramyl-(pentapeptide) pyrophosphoryl-undecaprenol N-acetylglucosamine transferase|nr:undecaprenyldiphospho-muramoylpentapeptide beta-N-acetylglucosaminyltransferase [Endomicrobium sp.]